jgi:secreted PhoX family phosphatase
MKRVALVLTLALGFAPSAASAGSGEAATGPFQFEPLPSSAACTPGGDEAQPLLLPPGYDQVVFEREGEPRFPGNPDMNTVNETGASQAGLIFGVEGAHAGRFLYRTHEVANNAAVTVTDMETVGRPGGPDTRTLARRADWEAFDGIRWTDWGTILAAEERQVARMRDPEVPQAAAGLVYEIDPETGTSQVRPAIGSRSHEGMDFDSNGNLYGISEEQPSTGGGYIYKFTPDRPNDLSSGQLYALKLADPTGDRVGEATWVPLDRTAVQVDSDVAATAAGATGYGRPEDVDLGRNRNGQPTLYVAVTLGNRVLAVDLREPKGGSDHSTAFVTDYVREGVNAPVGFERPDNLDFDPAGNLYITEDAGVGLRPGRGNDIWVATPDRGNDGSAEALLRFASVKDCTGEPTGVYFDERNHFAEGGPVLYVNVMRGAGGRDLAIAVMES